MENHTIDAYYNNDSEILILGSFPSVKSRELGFYYAHPQNRFWKVLSLVFEDNIENDIACKKEFLKKNKIALFDVIKSCEITGSSDASIKNIIPNDIAEILAKTNIKNIYVNGKTAYNLYNKYGDMMNPIAFTIFGMEIRYYSLFILFGVGLAYFLIIREAKKFSISTDFIFNMFFWSLVIGIVGARLYYVIFNWEYFASHIGEIWQIWQGGLAIHGGILFGLITINFYTKKYNIRTLKILDMVVVPLLIAQAIGRWGNFFNSEAYGIATSVKHLRDLHIPEFIIEGMTINGITYTPTFFYESLGCVLGFLVLIIFRRMKFVKVGQITGIYLIWYGVLWWT